MFGRRRERQPAGDGGGFDLGEVIINDLELNSWGGHLSVTATSGGMPHVYISFQLPRGTSMDALKGRRFRAVLEEVE